MLIWRGPLLPLPLRSDGRRRSSPHSSTTTTNNNTTTTLPFLTHPLLLSVALLCIVQGCCETNHEDALSSVYSSLVTGNGGGGSNGDDWGSGGVPSDAEYITAIIGESVVFNCHVEFPDGYPVPYIVQWDKKGVEIPIHIWYDGYPTHTGENYVGRVDRVNPNSSYGQASLNVTMIREFDRGWYNCRVFFLNRSPAPQSNKNISGSWYHLDVHAPPRFVHTSDDVVYTKIGKSIILHCRAEGTPAPEIVWYKDADPVQPSVTVSIVNEGTELRISQIKNDDIGDYTCLARNGEGKIHHVVKVLVAGSAVIINPPQNMTKPEGEKAVFPCEWRALPSNASVVWLRDGIPVRQISSLESRIETPAEGTLIINPIASDDSGFYECQVSNGIGGKQTAIAYLNVEYPAQVTYTPTVQYLPHRLAGVVRCYIMANPPIQFVMWTRDKHLLEPYEEEGFAVMNNGSLLIDRVKETHQGQYTCTPYNVHGTKGSSLQMQVIVKEPPKFDITPDPIYQTKLGAALEIPCSAVAPNGTNSPLITWQRKDGKTLPRDRVRVVEGSLMIENLHEADVGEYECVASNEVATLIFTTRIYIEGRAQAPSNVTGSAAVFHVTLTWIPGFATATDPSQNHIVRYRLLGQNKWETVHVTPQGSHRIAIRNLIPGKTYQFQVVGSGPLGLGEPSETINVTTKGVVDTILNTTDIVDPTIPGSSPSTSAKTNEILDYSVLAYPTDEFGSTYIPIILRPQGPPPSVPWNVSVVDDPKKFSFIVTWMPPIQEEVAVAYYRVDYKGENEQYKPLNKDPILPPQTSFTARHIKSDKKKYIFRVQACAVGGKCAESEEFPFTIPPRDSQKAIVAGVVGGILFFIVAIILSVCAVKICNRRKRRKQEKAYNMVACRLTDARNGGQIPTQPQIPPSATATLKKSGVARVRVVISWVKRAYRSVGRAVGRFIIHLLDLRLRRHAIILTTTKSRPQSISSIILSAEIPAHRQGIRHPRSSPLISTHGPPRGMVLPWDVVDEASSDDGGFLAPRPLRYFPRGRRRFNLVLPGSFVPSSSLIRPPDLDLHHAIPRPFASSPVPRRSSHSPQHSRSRSASSSLFSPDLNFNNMSTVPRFPVLVQVHKPPYHLWGTATTGRHYHPHHHHPATIDLTIDPTLPPWEAERLRDNLARDLDYLERQVPPFLKQPALVGIPDKSGSGGSSSVRFQERSSSSGFQSASKNTTSTIPSGQSSTGEILLRPIALPEEPAPVQTLYATFPVLPFRSLPPRTYENWPRRDNTPPIYAMARSPSFDVDEAPPATSTVPAPEVSPSTRTLSVDDPYEFDPVIPDTSPEIVYPPQPHPSTTTSTTSSSSRFKRTREKYENMEARVAAMKEEFFEYRRRQKKRMESAC